MAENVQLLALRLLCGFDEHISAQLLLQHHDDCTFWAQYPGEAPIHTGFTGLHGIAFLGIVEIAVALLEMKEWDVNAADCMGSTALTWAVIRGHEGVVKMLLEREDVNPN